MGLLSEGASTSSGSVGRLVFSQFNIQRVLRNGASLLGSEGAEYDVAEESFGEYKQELRYHLSNFLEGIQTKLFTF